MANIQNSKASVTRSAIKSVEKLSTPGKITAKGKVGRAFQGWRNRRLARKGVKTIRKMTQDFNRTTQGVTRSIMGGLSTTTGQIAAASTAADLSNKRGSYTGSLSAWMNNMDNNPDPTQGSQGSTQNNSTTKVGGGWESKL